MMNANDPSGGTELPPFMMGNSFNPPPGAVDFNNPPPPPPDGFGGSESGVLANSNGKREFIMSEKVNGFQAVTDYIGANFNDVSEDSPFYDAIMWAVGTGIAEGVTENTFEPEALCDRGQTAIYMWKAAGGSKENPNGRMMPPMIPVDGNPQGNNGWSPQSPETEIENPFQDITEEDEYYSAVLWAVRNGITNGIKDNEFAPQNIVTRGQSQAFLYRWTGSPEIIGENPFQDVTADMYCYQAVLWSVQNEITNGTTSTTFSPNRALKKGEFLTFLYRYAENDLMPNQFKAPPPMPPVGNPIGQPPTPPVGNQTGQPDDAQRGQLSMPPVGDFMGQPPTPPIGNQTGQPDDAQ